MPEVNVTISSVNSKYNEQDKNKHIKTTSLNRSIDMTTNETRLNPDNVVRRFRSYQRGNQNQYIEKEQTT